MKIKNIMGQHRRDFTAIYICEHCNHEEGGTGYDDNYFHESVIPKMKCRNCGKTSPGDYMPPTTKHQEHEVI